MDYTSRFFGFLAVWFPSFFLIPYRKEELSRRKKKLATCMKRRQHNRNHSLAHCRGAFAVSISKQKLNNLPAGSILYDCVEGSHGDATHSGHFFRKLAAPSRWASHYDEELKAGLAMKDPLVADSDNSVWGWGLGVQQALGCRGGKGDVHLIALICKNRHTDNGVNLEDLLHMQDIMPNLATSKTHSHHTREGALHGCGLVRKYRTSPNGLCTYGVYATNPRMQEAGEPAACWHATSTLLAQAESTLDDLLPDLLRKGIQEATKALQHGIDQAHTTVYRSLCKGVGVASTTWESIVAAGDGEGAVQCGKCAAWFSTACHGLDLAVDSFTCLACQQDVGTQPNKKRKRHMDGEVSASSQIPSITPSAIGLATKYFTTLMLARAYAAGKHNDDDVGCTLLAGAPCGGHALFTLDSLGVKIKFLEDTVIWYSAGSVSHHQSRCGCGSEFYNVGGYFSKALANHVKCTVKRAI